MSAIPPSCVLDACGRGRDTSVILGSVKGTSIPECDDSGTGGPGGGCASTGTAVTWLLILLLGAVGVVVAVFGHPVQAIAAAIIVSVLGALVQGRSVARSIADVAQVYVQSLKGTSEHDENGPWST